MVQLNWPKISIVFNNNGGTSSLYCFVLCGVVSANKFSFLFLTACYGQVFRCDCSLRLDQSANIVPIRYQEFGTPFSAVLDLGSCNTTTTMNAEQHEELLSLTIMSLCSATELTLRDLVSERNMVIGTLINSSTIILRLGIDQYHWPLFILPSTSR
jgi:hypothetical protein